MLSATVRKCYAEALCRFAVLRSYGHSNCYRRLQVSRVRPDSPDRRDSPALPEKSESRAGPGTRATVGVRVSRVCEALPDIPERPDRTDSRDSRVRTELLEALGRSDKGAKWDVRGSPATSVRLSVCLQLTGLSKNLSVTCFRQLLKTFLFCEY